MKSTLLKGRISMLRKTKIICTLGPATEDENILRRLMLGGMNAARFNFSHCTHEDAAKKFDTVCRMREELGLPVATILDTKGPEIRVDVYKRQPKHQERGGKQQHPTAEILGFHAATPPLYGIQRHYSV